MTPIEVVAQLQRERNELAAAVELLAGFVPIAEKLLTLLDSPPVGRSAHVTHRYAMNSNRRAMDELLARCQVLPAVCAALRRDGV